MPALKNYFGKSKKMMVLNDESVFMKNGGVSMQFSSICSMLTKSLGFFELGARKKLTIFKLRIIRENGLASRKSLFFLNNLVTFKTFETFQS